MAKNKDGKKKKKGGCIKGCLVVVAGVIFCVVILILGVIVGPIMKAMEFAQAVIEFFQGETDEEKLYDWVLINGANLELSLSAIEGMPYEVSAIETALECEVNSADENIYFFEVQDSAGNIFHPQYNLKTLTSNYGVPWQLLLAICTANQFGDIEDFVSNLDNTFKEGYRYKVGEQNIKDVYSVLGTKIEYITNYAMYGTDADGDRFNECPNYETFSANCITDLSADNTGKFSCIYKKTSAGNDVYYPVICLDKVSTWLYDYEFEYDLILDEEGRPIEYKLKNVKKSSHMKELLEDLDSLGISESMLGMLYIAIDTMPYASSRGITASIKKEYSYYKNSGVDSMLTDRNYDEYLALKALRGDVFDAEAIDRVWLDYREKYHFLDAEFFNNGNVLSKGIPESYALYHYVAERAMDFLYSVYYMPPTPDYEGNMESYVRSWYNCNAPFTSWYSEIGKPIDDADLAAAMGNYFKDGMLYGMTDWDFIVMVLYNSMVFEVSRDFIVDGKEKWDKTPSSSLWEPQWNPDWKGSKDYEHTHFTTADAFYDFCVSYYGMVYNQNAVPYKILNKTNNNTSSSRDGLEVGDLAFRVDGDKASAVGMYMGKINGYDAFIHLGGGSSDLGMYQPTVTISYHEDDGVMHPDGGTVNYNTYIRVDEGSYPKLDSKGKPTGGLFGWRY